MWVGLLFTCSHHDGVPYHSPKNNRANQSWTGTSKTVSYSEYFFFVSETLRYFISDRKLINTRGSWHLEHNTLCFKPLHWRPVFQKEMVDWTFDFWKSLEVLPSSFLESILFSYLFLQVVFSTSSGFFFQVMLTEYLINTWLWWAPALERGIIEKLLSIITVPYDQLLFTCLAPCWHFKDVLTAY